MKAFGSILFIFTLLLTGENQGIFHDVPNASPDSPTVNGAPAMPEDSISGPMAQQPDINKKYTYLTVDCPLSLPDSTSSRVKTFVPDIKLTDSMPIFKPNHLDEGIFIRGGDCYRIVPKN